MMGKLRISRPSPAMVVAMAALVVSMAGVGYAASKIDGKEIKKASIAGKKLKDNTLKSKQIKEASIRAGDLEPGVNRPQALAVSDVDPIAVGDGTSAFVNVATLSDMPAGDYVVNAKAEVQPSPLTGTDTAQVICRLLAGGIEVDRSRLQVGENTAAPPVVLRGTIPVQAAVTVPASGVVALQCAKGGAGIDINASERSLTAVAVNLR